MRTIDVGRKSIRKKLISMFLVLLFTATVLMGIVSYFLASSALNNKGEIILKNSVKQALLLIDSEQDKVAADLIEVDEAKENIGVKLLGPLNDDGTRFLHNEIDLGENGYFVVYSKEGYEILHPTLQGQYVWDVVDLADDQHFIVQEQIEVALTGGGFTYYSWLFPHSDTIGKKMSYAMYEPDWEWVVVATAYNIDFNSEARLIWFLIVLIMGVIIIVITIIVIRYVKRITEPIMSLQKGLENVSVGEYREIAFENSEDEIAFLGKGYNNMIASLKEADLEIVAKNKQLTFLAYHDELTGLSNRHGLKAYIESTFKPGQEIGYLIQMDLVGLKVINSILGFEQGNQILVLIGEFITGMGNQNLYPSRTSSNEFSLWVVNQELDSIKVMLHEFRQKLREHIRASGYNQGIDVYMAITVTHQSDYDFETLYEEATIAMRIAKEAYDSTVHIYEDSMREAMKNELEMRSYLREAIDNDEIRPYYQGKVDHRDGKYVGVEALARWHSKVLGFVAPNEFIPALTRLNLMHEFTEYIMDKVLDDYQKIMEKYGPSTSVSINIPPSYFFQSDFIANIQRMLGSYAMPAEKLILEITEDLFIGDYDLITERIEQLHELGIRISIDDFGTGYSSLNYLVNMKVDEIKIDKSFIDQMEKDNKAFELFKILCNIAQVYDYTIVAEGVETEKQLNMIKTTSLKIIQGYYFSKPESLD